MGFTGNTLRANLQGFLAGRVDALKEFRRSNSRGALDGRRTTPEAYFREHPPAIVKEAVAKIEEFTGIRRSETQVRKFLKSLGMRRLKVGYVPAKADPEEQERFKKEELEPRLDEARAGHRAVLFVDAAHVVLTPFVGYVWCIVRQFVRAAAGRQRLNVLAALDAITHQLVTVTNDTYINAHSVCQLLHKLAALRLGIPIAFVLDNARYQKCRLVQQLADELRIELLYLPGCIPVLRTKC